MPQIINTNIASINAQRNLNKSQSDNQTALQRLSSGLRINSAKDDAAGLAISTRFTSQIKGLNVAVRNAGDGIALAQTAEGALGTMNDNLQRIRELAVQSANATNSDVDRDALQAEVKQLVAEITRTAEETDFNGRKLLNGEFNAIFQVGANAGQTIDVSIAELTADKLGASSKGGISATGSDNALANGDLIINGQAITASRAEDDNASTSNAGASAIAKVAAINRFTQQTGVKAQVNTNAVAGTEMSASAASGTLELNGVSIDVQTTSNSSTTRASVIKAINLLSEQTGVTAVDSGFDNGGVQLQAKDGRNIEISFGGTLSAENTGLAKAGTYEGGYTLIANGDVKEIEIDGGNGTGNGDLANSGLLAGTYASGVSSVSSEAKTQDVSAEKGAATDGAASVVNKMYTKVTAGTLSAGAIGFSVEHNGSSQSGSVKSTSYINEVAAKINDFTGITAYESIKLNVNLGTAATTLVLGAGTAGTSAVKIGISGTSAALRAEDAVAKINAQSYTSQNMEIKASINSSGNVALDIKNFSSGGSTGMLAIDSSTAKVNVAVGTGAGADTEAAGTANYIQGTLAYQSDDGKKASLTLTDAEQAGTLFNSATNTAKVTEYKGVNGLEDGDLVINGVSIKAAQTDKDTASAEFDSNGVRILSSNKSLSAISVAASINAVSAETGVSAEVNATKVVGGNQVTQAEANKFDNGDQGEIFINGVSLGSVTLQKTDTNVDFAKAKADALALINQNTGKTGVTAVDNGESITLTAADGRNISVAINDKSGRNESIGKVFGLDASEEGIGESTFGKGGVNGKTSDEADTYETTYGTIKLDSAKEIDLQVGNNGSKELEALGFDLGKFGAGQNGQFLKDIDISTFEGAQEALTAIDNAIGAVASQRADLGAIQNRMQSTVNNLQVTSENLSAANSRIQDADFAAETAELSRTQVLQQAGISILAQANASGQQVLSLLG